MCRGTCSEKDNFAPNIHKMQHMSLVGWVAFCEFQVWSVLFVSPSIFAGIILYMRPANEKWRYIVTSSLIGTAHSQNDPCCWIHYHRLLDYVIAGIILCMRPANGRQRYNVTSSLIGWGHAQNAPCYCGTFLYSYKTQYLACKDVICSILCVFKIWSVTYTCIVLCNIIIPPETKFRGGILDSPCSSVCLSVCPSVRPSVRPWVGVRMITLILFSGFKIFFLHISLGSRSCMGLNISVLPH